MSGNNAYSSYSSSFHQHYDGEEDADDQYHEEVEDNLEYDNNLDDSSYRKRNYLTYEEYALDEEDERLIREELGEYDNNQSLEQKHEEEENFDDVTEEFLLSKVNELNKLAIQIDVLSFGGDQQEIEETRAEMDNIIAYICKVTKVNRNIENYIKSDNKRISSSLPSLFIDLKSDIRKLFYSTERSILAGPQTSFNTTQDQNEIDTQRDANHYNSIANEHNETKEEYEQEDEDDHDEEQHDHEEEEYQEGDGNEGSDQESQESYQPYEPTYFEDDVDYTLDAEDDELSNASEEDPDDIKLLDSLRDQCKKKSIELIHARNEREKALTIYHFNEMEKKDPNSKEKQELIQQLIKNCQTELEQLNREIERFSKEATEIKNQTELNKPPSISKPKKIPKTPEKKRIERIEHMVQEITTPRTSRDAQLLLTPSQLKERQENSDLQNMYNRLEASLSRTPQAKSINEDKPKASKPKQTVNNTKTNDSNLSIEPSKEKKARTVSSSGPLGASIENPRKKAAERLKEKIQREKEQKEKEELERFEKVKKLEEICHKQQAIILEERKTLTTKKYLDEILSDDSDEERMKEMIDEEKRKIEEEKVIEARKKAILRAKEKKRKEIERERELEEERRKKEAEKWRKRDEGLMAFKLKQEMEKEKKTDVRSSLKPAMPQAQPVSSANPKQRKEPKPAQKENSRKSTTYVTDSPLLDGLDANDNHDYLQFSPPPPMFSTSKSKK